MRDRPVANCGNLINRHIFDATNKKLVVTSASLLVTSALLVVTRTLVVTCNSREAVIFVIALRYSQEETEKR